MKFDGTPLAPIPSASILMLRDTARGLEVFLLKRHGLSDVLGGAYVFPGGKLDPEDVELVARLDQPLSVLHEQLGEPQLSEADAAALYVAAIREAFEETGVLYAAAGAPTSPDAWTPLRQGHLFVDVLERIDTTLTTTGLAAWSRWITPADSILARKHFDARFFVAAVPPGQQPLHDDHEATDSVWIRPANALREYCEGKTQLAPPQIMSLTHLSRFANVAEVLSQARGRKPFCVQPVAVMEGDSRIVCFPGDEGHPVRPSVMPGPTRLYWRGSRYEPDGGLATLLE